MKAFTTDGRRLDSAYNFDFLYAPDLTADLVRRSLTNWDGSADEGWPSWAFSNHDPPRATTRWSGDDDFEQIARLNMLLLLSLRGNPIIYQGEELGLPQGHVAFADLQDPEAITNWPHTLGRDGARTPLPWSAQKPQAGFSNANSTWLKVDPAHTERAIDRQSGEPGSVANYTRKLLAIRGAHPALVHGASKLLDTPADIVAFVRRSDEGEVLCAFNLGHRPAEWTPPAPFNSATSIASEAMAESAGPMLTTLAPRSGYWAVAGGK